MIIRTLKLVHFRGVPDLHVRDLDAEGVHRVELPAGTPGSVLVDAVRFAFRGPPDGSGHVITGDEGYAYVEVGFRLPSDAQASVFRGLDRRGNEQVSLREEGGLRVTGGAAGVGERLRELLGDDPDAWLAAATLDAADLAPDEVVEVTEIDPAGADGDTDSTRLAPDAPEAVEGLRRALRADRLRLLAARRHGDLLAIGRRLRRERATTALEVDRVSAERERVRTRLRRVNEYRDMCARAGVRAEQVQRAEVQRADNGGGTTEWCLATCASVLLLILVMTATSANPSLRQYDLQVGLGVGFLVAAGCYLYVASRRLSTLSRFIIVPDESPARAVSPSPAEAPATVTVIGPEGSIAPEEPLPSESERWRESLRARFADLGDPDDPNLVRELRRRASELDAELVPLHERLESGDDALAVFDVEAGRAARSLHLPRPDEDVAETGLDEGETLEGTTRDVADLGDAVYQATVRRDALLAAGAPGVADARAKLATSVTVIADDAGRADDAAALVRRVDSFVPEGVDEPREDTLCDALVEDVEELSGMALEAQSTVSASDASDASGDDVVREATGGRFASLRTDSGGGVELIDDDGTSVTWDDVPAESRTAIVLATRLRSRRTTLSSTPPQFVVLDGLPGPLTDGELLAAARSAGGDVMQVILAAD